MKNNSDYDTNFYTPEDVMNILHLGRSQVYKLFNSETFPSLKIGGSLRIDAKRVEEWCERYVGRKYVL